mmetsp:Transcript_124155/g.351530  ORF Transcript_124155/g.351530 Transcript_124155/m.351530 type:complete len:221 (-) Transcript_124155:14-676(-)
MCAAAAIVGTRIGQQLARDEIQRKDVQRKNLDNMQKGLNDLIIKRYDSDESGQLDIHELKPMLIDYSRQVFMEATKPSDDDVEFILALVDSKKTGGISRGQVNAVTEVWGEFLKQKEDVKELMEQYDENSDLQIGPGELQNILNELYGGRAVDPEVTAWVMTQADLRSRGVLCDMELARALCAFDRWRQGQADPEKKRLSKGIEIAENLPPPKSPVCILL